jgi:hypothetical protein
MIASWLCDKVAEARGRDLTPQEEEDCRQFSRVFWHLVCTSDLLCLHVNLSRYAASVPICQCREPANGPVRKLALAINKTPNPYDNHTGNVRGTRYNTSRAAYAV